MTFSDAAYGGKLIPAPVALVTGAARRIGRTIALTLAQRGWDVAVHCHASVHEADAVVREILALGRRAVVLPCDLADQDAVRALVGRAQSALGTVRCVVNNASLFESDSIVDFTQAGMDRHMHINLAAPVLLAQALHDATPEGVQACVVNILDQKLNNLNPDFLSYTFSKAALQCATTTLAQALAPKVRVVGVSPGATLVSTHQNQHNFDLSHRVAALGHSSTPQDIADAVHFLACARAITGTILVVDGGQHLIPLARDVMFTVPAQGDSGDGDAVVAAGVHTTSEK